MIRDQQVYIDGKAQPFPPESESYFRVVTNGHPLDEVVMKEEYGIDINNTDEFRLMDSPNQYNMLLSWSVRERLLKDGLARTITSDKDSTVGEVFPYDTLHAWTRDNYGPVWIPQKGATLTLTAENYPLYERVIRTYEGNKLEMKEGRIFLNDQEAHTYQFKLDYYWLMGDALHGSQDSRYWGFLPEDHIVGKASFIWWSYDNGLRWNRFFKKVE
jgi:signal peptidase I